MRMYATRDYGIRTYLHRREESTLAAARGYVSPSADNAIGTEKVKGSRKTLAACGRAPFKNRAPAARVRVKERRAQQPIAVQIAPSVW